jgi:peptide/nickel transport system substrate-binding protein
VNQNLTKICATIVATGMLLTTGAIGADLRIGLKTESSSIDPHYRLVEQNNLVRMHIFESLVRMNNEQTVVPGLAESWRVIDDKTWEFKLRKGVKFHNGAAFTANDFVYTVCRIPNVLGVTKAAFVRYIRPIKSIETPNPHTLIIRTKTPYAMLLNELSTFGIVSAKTMGVDRTLTFDGKGCGIKNWPETVDFNNGKLAQGTGPFKFVSYVRKDRITLVRNDEYWGIKPDWDRVTLRPINNSGSRMAALLAGDVDIVDVPPPQDIARLKKDPKFEVAVAPSQIFIYLQFEHHVEPAPGITGTNGKNPFRDKRVRKAFSMALDRQAIVDRIMLGYAEVATNVMGSVYLGHNHDLKGERFDATGAKNLLASAGYANGFNVIMGVTTDRYFNDKKIGLAVAQMLSRIGIGMELDAAPYAVYRKNWRGSKFGFFQGGLAVSSADMAHTLRALVGTKRAGPGFGVVNTGHYTNPEFDKLVNQALVVLDPEKRDELLQQANRIVMEDYGIVPVLHPMNTWAFRKGLEFKSRTDAITLAVNVKSAR